MTDKLNPTNNSAVHAKTGTLERQSADPKEALINEQTQLLGRREVLLGFVSALLAVPGCSETKPQSPEERMVALLSNSIRQTEVRGGISTLRQIRIQINSLTLSHGNNSSLKGQLEGRAVAIFTRYLEGVARQDFVGPLKETQRIVRDFGFEDAEKLRSLEQAIDKRAARLFRVRLQTLVRPRDVDSWTREIREFPFSDERCRVELLASAR